MRWLGGILGRCGQQGKPYPCRSQPASCRPWRRAAGFRDGSVMNARKTDGFLASMPGRLVAMKLGKKTRCENHHQIAPPARSFLMDHSGFVIGRQPILGAIPGLPGCRGSCPLKGITCTSRGISRMSTSMPLTSAIHTSGSWATMLFSIQGECHRVPRRFSPDGDIVRNT